MFTRLKYPRIVLLALALGAGSIDYAAEPAPSEQAQMAVIASNLDSLQKIDDGSLREIYLKRVFLNTDGRPYIPVNLPATHPLRDAFLSAVLKMNPPQMQIYWDRRYFQGVSPPYVLGPQRAVVRFVAATPGAIGYVQRCQVTPNVHVILLVSLAGVAPADTLEKCPNSAMP
jgi:ABC-type phosphate transport system substrate-binding protein